MEVCPHDPRLRWEGAISIQRSAEWAMPWRVPFDQLDLFPEPLNVRAAMPAGVRITFRSDTTTLAGTIEPHAELGPLDLCVDGSLRATLPLAGATRFHFECLPPGDKSIELWLPPSGQFRLRGLALDEGATLSAGEDARPRWV